MANLKANTIGFQSAAYRQQLLLNAKQTCIEIIYLRKQKSLLDERLANAETMFALYKKRGWDTHGLPVELGVEKKLGITKENIGKTISVADYNKECRSDVMKFTREWEDLTNKMGYWVDMSNPYITYDNRYIETLWYLLKQLYEKGFLYKGYTIQPYSPAAAAKEIISGF